MRELAAENPQWAQTTLRSSKYLNNMIEQDHRNVKLRIGPRLGFKRFQCASITIAGIELMQRIRKEQFSLDELGFRGMLRPQSGMRCSPHERNGEQLQFCVLVGNLHHTWTHPGLPGFQSVIFK
jgi:hypothetical protein